MLQSDVIIHRGSPSQAEAEAILDAIATLVADDAARTTRSHDSNPWVFSARLRSTSSDASIMRGRVDAWRLAGRTGPTVSNLQPGRGDAR